MKSKKAPLIIALIVSLALGGYATLQFLNIYYFATADTMAVVAVKDIKIYETITEDMVEMQSVPHYVVDGNTCTSLGDVVGKTSKYPVFKDKVIDNRNFASSQDIKDYQVVGVNMGTAGTANVTAGDVVDVYWVSDYSAQQGWAGENAEKLSVPASASLISRDARVVNIESEDKLTSSSIIAYLLVPSQDVSAVIRGSMMSDTESGIALAKKAGK